MYSYKLNAHTWSLASAAFSCHNSLDTQRWETRTTTGALPLQAAWIKFLIGALYSNTSNIFKPQSYSSYTRNKCGGSCALMCHYNNNKSDVYVCLLDLSKALKMSETLLSRNMPAIIVRILLFMYENQLVRTNWNKIYFKVVKRKSGALINKPFSSITENLQWQTICCYYISKNPPNV